MEGSIFREESIKKVSSPEELHDYIKVSSPSVWLLIGAVVALLIGFLVWSAFGTLDNTVMLSGVANHGVVRCYTADASALKTGDRVTVNGAEGTVRSVSERPLSREEAEADCGGDAYTIYCLKLSDWNYVVELSVPEAKDGVAAAKVYTEQIRVISFIFD